MRVFEAVAEALAGAGVTQLFGLVGEGNVALTSELALVHGAGYVAARREDAAVSMADGYARACGRVGVATVIRFERTGRASFENVLRIARALRAEDSFERLFEMPPYTSLDEALKEPDQQRPRRVRRKK